MGIGNQQSLDIIHSNHKFLKYNLLQIPLSTKGWSIKIIRFSLLYLSFQDLYTLVKEGKIYYVEHLYINCYTSHPPCTGVCYRYGHRIQEMLKI